MFNNIKLFYNNQVINIKDEEVSLVAGFVLMMHQDRNTNLK